uniref:Ribosomal protein L13 n=1 Tax=Olisthodiscus luteus TaxID=83000 RepID=A0A7U0QFZ4_OLILU|nr:ribosomal protein L13 [Olisthodiscus luteus]QQW50574.1 ribosomal protein L13 [Olisthodiscus luteus]
MNKTYLPSIDQKKKKWYLIDAKNKTLGRLATIITTLLQGKNNAMYTPFLNTGSYVVVVNAKYIKVTGNKYNDKLYYRHSRYPGSLKIENFKDLQNRIPERILEKAVKGMLPKGKLGRQFYKQLKIYSEESHPYTSQNIETINSNIYG